MAKKLMIVESPAKSKKISGFLGPNYTVLATVGSMFDIDNPKSEAAKKKYDTHGISTSDWERHLICSNRKQFTEIKKKVSSGQYDELIVATDPDRAGSQIGQEVVDALTSELKKNNMKVSRAKWTEITKDAVEQGLSKKGFIDPSEVDAATSRQIYDRLFGYSISPVLWKTVARGTSGGRVQSPALRLIVNREKDRLAFVKASYMSITGLFGVNGSALNTKLVSLGARKVATGTSFDSKGQLKGNDVIISPDNWTKLEPILKGHQYDINDVSTKPYTRKPPAPYTTSSFQQDVGTRLNMSSKQIMQIAQKIYEAGLITYMRTDSPALGEEGLKAARNEAVRLFGQNIVPATPNIYKSKNKNAQEGHEAIRPTVDKSGNFQTPATLRAQLNAIDKSAAKVYECIYNRAVASQMNDAKGFTTTVTIASLNTPDEKTVRFATSATLFTEPGWTALTKPVSENEEENNSLNTKVSKGDDAKLKKLTPQDHSTKPPARFTEPQLVAKLEELSIGRPSTYATIVTINQTRGYVQKNGQQLYPTWIGMKVAQYLEANAASFVSYEATAEMEEELDKIEDGSLTKDKFLKIEWDKVKTQIVPLGDNINWDEVNKTSVIELNNGYQVRVNNKGAWLEDLSQEKNKDGFQPSVRLTDKETVADIDFSDAKELKKLFEAASSRVDSRELGVLTDGPYAGYTITARDGRFGPYIQAEKVNDTKTKPVNMTMPEGEDVSSITFAKAEILFSEIKLPRTLNDNFFVGIGKRGPWIGHKVTAKARRAVFVSLPEEYDPRTMSLEDAKKVWDDKQQEKTDAAAKKEAKKTAAPRKTAAKKNVSNKTTTK